MSELKDKQKVTVFGAGVAGLTAAHELAERGFTVEVIDPDIRVEVHGGTLDRGVGGMARSQFACQMIGLPLNNDDEKPALPRLRSSQDFLIDDVIVFDASLSKPLRPQYAETVLQRLSTLLGEMYSAKIELNQMSICVVRTPGLPNQVDVKDDPRTVFVMRWLENKFSGDEQMLLALRKIRVRDQAPADIARAGNPPDNMPVWLRFEVRGVEIYPAEHGFRFFPSFYRHLFDTLKRVRILHPRGHERGHETVMDNLLPSEGLGFARDGKATSFVVPRGQVKSVEEARNYINLVLTQLEYTLSDIQRFGLKIFKYMTSSSARRQKEYETTSWGRFVDQHAYSEVSSRHIETGPQMSAALRGSESDARTQGNITIQLMMDQLRPNAHTDSTLNGPTSSAWLDHWNDYLRQQGVAFRRGKLVDFEIVGDKIKPVVEGAQPRGEVFVLALSLPAMAELAPKFEERARLINPNWDAQEPNNDFRRVVSFAGAALELQLAEAKPKAPLQHLSGIQFYFDVDVHFWRGHTQYLDSKWGLTSIAQPQFWGRQRDVTDAYRSVLSVDIGIWDEEYKGLRAWDCEPNKIARLAWEQIRDHHAQAIKDRYGPKARVPDPIAYALDENIVFSGKSKRDKTPFLVNQTGAFDGRPGNIIHGKSKSSLRGTASKQKSVYEVYFDRYVLAGTFMKTYTRLTSMEGANESARHAVNALLTTLEIAGDRCEIWDPEDNELPTLQWLRDLDQRLVADGRPHLVDILSVRELSKVGLVSAASAFGRRA